MRCKNCKEKFEQYQFNNKFCKEIDCQTAKAMYLLEKNKLQIKKQWDQEKKEFKERDKSLPQVANDTQKVFNEYIRLRDEGCVCISCQKPPKKKNAGHYHNANNHWNVRFNEDNVHLQCEHCNNSLSGNLIKYRKILIKKIGKKRFTALQSIAEITRKYSREELYEIKALYRKKLKALKEARKNGVWQIGEIDIVENQIDNHQHKLF